VDLKRITDQVAGLSVSVITEEATGGIAIHFTNGSFLLLERRGAGLAASYKELGGGSASEAGTRPTHRQRQYLEFIQKYMARFGVAPAESDIQRHFLVSAPSVNQMIRTLERRGLITRKRDLAGHVIPRSIRIPDAT
jgi:repressor LexA